MSAAGTVREAVNQLRPVDWHAFKPALDGLHRILLFPAYAEALVARQMVHYGDEVFFHHEFARWFGAVALFALPLLTSHRKDLP